MSDYHLNKVRFDAAREHKIVEAITDEERQALEHGDITRLYELGANPYLIRRVFRPRFHI